MQGSRLPTVYIMANRRHGTLYTGVTSNLPRRVDEHRNGTIPGFTKQYGCRLLVYFEAHADMSSAISREKQIKGGSRSKKIAMIECLNPTWADLYDDLT